MKRLPALPAIAALLLAGCASVPGTTPRVAQVAPTELGLDPATAAIAPDWWAAFGDPQLDRLVAMGVAANPSLDEALARVREAAAEIDVQRAALRPQITGTGQISRARIAPRLFDTPGGSDPSNLALAYGSLNWDLDLFGRQHAAVRRAAASAEALRLDAEAARLSIAVAITQSYVSLARAEKLIDVAQGFVETRERAVGYAQSRVRNQLGSQFDIKQAETLLGEAQQVRTQATQQRDVLVHALAALVGRGADFYPQIARPAIALDHAPGVPSILPADLLGRRPDLLAGQARIEAAVQGRQIAKDAFLPDVSISALAGLTAIGLGNFFSGGAFTWTAGPAVHVPIFEGGKLRAQYRGATADLDEAVASYNDDVVAAVRDAADAITNIRAADEGLADQGRVVQGLRDTVRLDNVRVRTGLGSQLDTIDSGFRLLEAEQSLVDMQADALTRRVQLIAALGGGYDPQKPAIAAARTDPRS